MKKNLINLFVIGLLIWSCNNNKDNENKSDKRGDSLQNIVNEKDQAITNILGLFTDVQKNLDSISKREKNIYVKTEKPENLKTVVMEEINKDIRAINEIIIANKKNIISINRKLKQALSKNTKLEEAISALNQQLGNKESELKKLKEELNDYDIRVSDLLTTVGFLNEKNEELEVTVANEIKMLQTAYYITGTSKQLQKDSVIDKEGGLLGMGRTAHMRNNFKQEKFKKIDYNEVTVIPVDSRKIKIVTTHPLGSYKLDEENGVVISVMIIDPLKFWSVSKYLVIIKS